MAVDAHEEWRVVLDGDYEVSSLGRVRRARPGKRTFVGKILKPNPLPHGYLQVGVTIDGKNHQRYVHRLVAEAFVGPCPEGYEVNHIDGNKANNHAANLEYVTRAGNMRHAYATGLVVRPVMACYPKQPRRVPRGEEHWMRHRPEGIQRGEQCGSSKLTEDDVRAIRAAIAAGGTCKAVGAQFGIAASQVCLIANKKSWRHVA